MRQRRFAVMVLLFLTLGCQPDSGGLNKAVEIPSDMSIVEGMAGRTDLERRQWLKKTLKESGIPFSVQDFRRRAGAGQNIEITFGEGPAELLIAAHYDAAKSSPGANDNASGVAVALATYAHLRAGGPLAGLRVRFLFFDDEEDGLLGSQHFAATQKLDKIVAVLSLEMCGIGDSVGLWDVSGKAVGSPFVKAIGQAAKALRVRCETHGRVPLFTSDHAVFARAGIAAFGMSVLPESEEALLREFVADPRQIKWLNPKNRPRMFQTYHSPGDTLQTIDPLALETAAKVLARAIRLFQKSAGA